jgi:hypothetical protein
MYVYSAICLPTPVRLGHSQQGELQGTGAVQFSDPPIHCYHPAKGEFEEASRVPHEFLLHTLHLVKRSLHHLLIEGEEIVGPQQLSFGETIESDVHRMDGMVSLTGSVVVYEL